jgi:hypothetical protein
VHQSCPLPERLDVRVCERRRRRLTPVSTAARQCRRAANPPVRRGNPHGRARLDIPIGSDQALRV